MRLPNTLAMCAQAMRSTTSKTSSKKFATLIFICSLSMATSHGGTAAASTAENAKSPSLEFELVAEIHRASVYDGLAVSAGHIWVGLERMETGQSHRIAVYNSASLNLVDTVDIRHTASYVYPWTDGVVVVGKSSTPYWQTFYTTITISGGNLHATTTAIPVQYQVDHFTGDANQLFFTEPGERGIYLYDGGSMQKVGADVSGPGPMVLVHHSLWLVERRSFGFGDESVTWIDPSTGDTRRLTAATGNGMVDISHHRSSASVAVAEAKAQRVLIFDAATTNLSQSINVNGRPWSTAEAGRCLVVLTQEPRSAIFVDLSMDPPQEIATWDLSSAGEAMHSPKQLSVDIQNQELLVRSSAPCPTCVTSRNSVFRVKEPGDGTFADCLR